MLAVGVDVQGKGRNVELSLWWLALVVDLRSHIGGKQTLRAPGPVIIPSVYPYLTYHSGVTPSVVVSLLLHAHSHQHERVVCRRIYLACRGLHLPDPATA